ncbi:MAG: hypothetical protein H0X03_02815 [Nitrosopumilus sp.]|nr:hypothetical protein [Nitrosopumilus sp.]
MQNLDPNKLKFKTYDPTIDSLSDLDFSQNDGSDPLLVDQYVKCNLSKGIVRDNYKIYIVKYEGSIIAFFTLSMSVICSNNLCDDEKDLKNFIYPALLMGKIGIDKKYRCFKIGNYICLYCLGLAQKTNEKIACSFFVFRTTQSLAEKIYGPKYYFRWRNTSSKIVRVYRRII